MENASLTGCTKLILALDIEDRNDALDLLKRAGNQLDWVKIGLQMFTKYGPDYVREIADLGKKVFLDLKLHDIPNTVAKAVESVSELPISMLTIHTCGGSEMMQRAVEAQQKHKPDLQLLGVTVLTSMNDEQLAGVGVNDRIPEQISRLAQLAKTSGMSGLVCSPLEVQMLKSQLGPEVKLVTPGVRPIGADAGDQKRIMTPAKAKAAGSDYIVVGRPIYKADDPKQAVASILADLS